MFDNDSDHGGGSSRRLLAALWTASWPVATAESSSMCNDLAVLHDTLDGGAVGSVSLLPRTAARHVLGSVCVCY